MAFVTIYVVILGEALGELPESADVVCACHGLKVVDESKKRLPASILEYLYCSGRRWAQLLTMPILQAVFGMWLVCSGGPRVSLEV